MSWKSLHLEVIKDFLSYLNYKSDEYILKGGTSLMLLYNLDRFSEDIDLDGINKPLLKNMLNEYCQKNGYDFRIAKDTETVLRYMVYYKDMSKPLKIEASFRKNNLFNKDIVNINNIATYSIDKLCNLKILAYNGRTKIRDLYDLVFIANNYWEKLSDNTKDLLSIAFTYKGLDYFDYIVENQKDELINRDFLEAKYLLMMDKLGLLENS